MKSMISKASCLNLKPHKVKLIGQLRQDVFPGNHRRKSGEYLYEKEDAPETGLYLNPTNPVCEPKESENPIAYRDVWLGSIKIDDPEASSEELKARSGHFVILTGLLSSRDAEHHPSAPYILRKSAIGRFSGKSKISGIYESSRDFNHYGAAVLIIQNGTRNKLSVYLSIIAPNQTHHTGEIAVSDATFKNNVLTLRQKSSLEDIECDLKIQISNDEANVVSEEGECSHGTAASFVEQGQKMIKKNE